MKTGNDFWTNVPTYVILQRMTSNLSKPEKPTNLLKVPHIKQANEQSCGAASLCMVYKYYELEQQTKEKIWFRLKKRRNLDPNQEITYIDDLYNDIRSNGLHNIKGQAVWEEPEKIFELLKEFLRIEVPLIVCQRWREEQPFGHYKIVLGLEENFVVVNDPEFDEDKIKVPKDRFVEDWKYYSDEVQGGWFIAALNEEQIKKIQKLPLMNFWADIRYYEASNFQFLP